jgi:hypothetical protein
MTETGWLGYSEPKPMLEFLSRTGVATLRKQRLFAVACCRRIWHLLKDERSRAAVEVAERLADGLASDEDRHIAFVSADEATENMRGEGAAWYHAACAAEDLVYAERMGLFDSWYDASLAGESEEPAQADLVRDIFGNPFRPVVFDPRWRTETAVALAAGIDAERAFDRLPILADALEDAGCDHADILHHCRGPGPHVRGCWVVELVLGKE